MADRATPDPHREIERVADQREAWRWSIYAGEGGPPIERSKRRYPSTDAARRDGDNALLAIRPRAELGTADRDA